MDKQIVAFAYDGEFSYSVGWWYPKIRKIAHTLFSDHHIIAFDRCGRGGLCKDFVHEFIPYDFATELGMGWPTCGISRDQKTNQWGGDILDPKALQFVRNYKKSHNIEFQHLITPMNFNKWSHEKHNLMGGQLTIEEDPWGEYISLEASPEIQKSVLQELKENLDPRYPIITIMARTRNRLEAQDAENWDPSSWQTLVNRLVKELDVNVVCVGVPPQPEIGYPGALSLDGKDGRVYSMVRRDPDYVEKQIAVLRYSKCAIYGASGAAFLTFFTNTPVFIISHKHGCSRLVLPWCKKLTEGHKYVRIYKQTMDGKEYYNQGPNTIFQEFKNFYKGLPE